MNIILGGTGRVGSAVVRELLQQGEPVTIVTRTQNRGLNLEQRGAHIAALDIRNTDQLRALFRSGKRAFLLNPSAAPSQDTDTEERATVKAILEALDGSGLEKVVLASTYGARPGERCGDLTVLHEFEEKLKKQSIPAAINRGAYYMSNWSEMIDTVRSSGKLITFLPANLAVPMVAPEDLGKAAADRLLGPVSDTELWHVEGPKQYSSRDVAEAFSQTLHVKVQLEVIPSSAWVETFMKFGFSKAAAESYACMTSALVNGEMEKPSHPKRGQTSLESYIRKLVP